MVCRRVVFFGRVQGVGFRWTTSRIAKRHEVSGTVRNCADGSVEIIAQGTAIEVERFLSDIASTMAANIERSETAEESVQADLSGFAVIR